MDGLRGHIYLGSSYGWLFTIDEELDGHLLNPLTQERYKLPAFPDYNEGRTIEDAKALQGHERYHIQSRLVIKAILSDDPSEGRDFTLVTLYRFNRVVVFWRPGDTNWTELKCPYGQIQDVTYFNGALFRIIGCYCLVYFDLGPDPKLTPRYPLVRKRHWSKEAHLVDLDGESLLLIQRIEAVDKDFRDLDEEELEALSERHRNGIYYEDEHRHFATKKLRVFELDLENGTHYEWDDIDGSALFLGRGTHVVVDPAGVRGCVPDRISYSGVVSEPNGFDNVGFYDMGSKTVGEYDPEKVLIRHHVSPAWFTPNPW